MKSKSWFAAVALALASGHAAHPPGVNPDLLSGGRFAAFDAPTYIPPDAGRLAAGAESVSDLSKGSALLVLDARVAPNVRLGDDPAALPATQRGQAEPHVARSPVNPDVLLATFQEGRLAEGAAVGCGYAWSRDGGFTWTRSLIPDLTFASGGRFLRATDPVAAIGPQGDFYLNTLAFVDNTANQTAIVVSRSMDQGNSWSRPITVFESQTGAASLDKNWIAVNDTPGARNAGRLAVTWSVFTPTAVYLQSSISDDRGATWSAPANLTPVTSVNQSTQPVFLPDGALLVPYVTFLNTSPGSLAFRIETKVSGDGGRTWPTNAVVAVNNVLGWDDPDLRDGVYLIGSAVARTTGDAFISYTAVVDGSPRVLVTKSSNRGATWSAPRVVSDNPAGVSVMNPAVAVTPDGRRVTLVWMDRRHSTAGLPAVDHYAAVSLDGGNTWQPNLRLTDKSSDIRLAPPTSRGYMLGDYLGLVAPTDSELSAVAVWCDTRTGNSDPFATRFALTATPGFDGWRTLNFNRTDLADAALSGPAADPDGDGYGNLIEYAQGTNPGIAESGSGFFFAAGASGTTLGDRRAAGRTDVQVNFENSTDRTTWTPALANPAALVTAPAQGLFDHPNDRTTFFRVKYTLDDTVLYSPDTPAANNDARLNSLATRGVVRTGGAQLIAGFATTGGSMRLLARAAGPSLAPFGIADTLADPQLTLIPSGSSTVVAANNDWDSTASPSLALAFLQAGVFPFPNGSKDAALVFTTGTANAGYTATVSGAGGQTGTGLVEIYDISAAPTGGARPRLLSVATRGEVAPGGPLVAGFVLGGTQPRRVLIRAGGPALAAINVAQAIPDPKLSLYRGARLLAENDDWSVGRSPAAIAATATLAGAFAFAPDSLDSALLVTLEPGAYTAVVAGVDGSRGLSIVEVYDVN